MPYALAEGLKVTRILEVSTVTPNCTPIGARGYDVYFQRQFEHIIERLSRETPAAGPGGTGLQAGDRP